MRILDKYITRQFIMPFLTCLFIFYFLFIIGDILGHLDDFSEKQVSFTVLFQYYAAWIPIIFVRTCPIAIVLSTLFTLGILNKNNEITGMKASGISLFRIIFPFLFSSLILSFIVLIVNDYYVPKAEFTTTKTKEEKIEKKGVLSQKIIENVSLHGENNKIYIAQKYDVSKKILYMLTITQHDDLKRVRAEMRADKACWEDKTKQWRFYNLVTVHKDEKGRITKRPVLQKEVLLSIPEKPEDFLRHQDESTFMSYLALKKHISRLRSAGSSTHQEQIDLYRKIAFPFANLIIVLVAIPFALNAPRSGALIGVVLGIGFCLLYYILEAVILAVGKEGFMPPLLAAWLANIGFGTAGGYLIYRLRFPR